MQAIRFGRILRALRRRRGWRQLDLAARARCSQQSISRLERGDLVGASLGTIQRVLAALEADVDLAIRWRGGTIDRLVDAGHARLVDAVARRLARLGFDVRPEVSYAEFGERGSIDILAIDVRARILIVVEVKTELTSMEATLRKHDEKVRLAPTIVRRRLGLAGPWRVVPILVLPESGASRRRVTGQPPSSTHAIRSAVATWPRGWRRARSRTVMAGSSFCPSPTVRVKGAADRRPTGSGVPTQAQPSTMRPERSDPGRGAGNYHSRGE
jgi:transcriptional regulator with XRE-family HTH domain